MLRLLMSGLYVGPNFLASIAVVSLISNYVSSEQRVEFFLFMSLFYPLTSIAGQTRAIQTLNKDSTKKAYRLDFIIFFAALILIYQFLKANVSVVDLMLLSFSIILSYQASTQFVKVQMNASSPLVALLPLLTSIARVFVCWAVLSQGYIWGFFVSSLVFFVLPKLYNLRNLPNVLDDKQQKLSTKTTSVAAFTLVAYVVSSAFFFQWDRLLMSSVNLVSLIEQAGVYVIWALSPISIIYATVYRAEAGKVFKKEFEMGRYLYVAKRFLALAAIYLLLQVVFWKPLNSVLFPFFSGEVWLGVLLTVSVVLDRLGTLLIYMGSQSRQYFILSLVKLSLVFGAVAIYYFQFIELSLLNLYVSYIVVSLTAFLASLMLVTVIDKDRQLQV